MINPYSVFWPACPTGKKVPLNQLPQYAAEACQDAGCVTFINGQMWGFVDKSFGVS